MRWSQIGNERCSVAKSLSVIGDRWTMLVLREAFLRTRRFEDFQRRTRAPRPILADRLRRLVDHGVLERRPYGNHPDRHDYRLTEKGIDLYPVIVALLQWGDRWTLDGDDPPIEVRHRACGHIGLPELACPACGSWVGARDMEVADAEAITLRA
jgi:DNA-binding HxlR family transcriptional regulator